MKEARRQSRTSSHHFNQHRKSQCQIRIQKSLSTTHASIRPKYGPSPSFVSRISFSSLILISAHHSMTIWYLRAGGVDHLITTQYSLCLTARSRHFLQIPTASPSSCLSPLSSHQALYRYRHRVRCHHRRRCAGQEGQIVDESVYGQVGKEG